MSSKSSPVPIWFVTLALALGVALLLFVACPYASIAAGAACSVTGLFLITASIARGLGRDVADDAKKIVMEFFRMLKDFYRRK